MSSSLSLTHLKLDPIMAQLIDQHPLPVWRDAAEIDLFTEVITSIISQQLSVKAADAIENRFLNLFPQHQITPPAILQLDDQVVRQCGLSFAKIKYIKSAATASINGDVDFDNLINLSDEDVIAELIKIHGVGRWTAEMLLMFSLQRPDIFSIGDLGLRTAVSKLYGVERTNLPAIETIALQWSPHRSLASRYLWLNLDNAPK